MNVKNILSDLEKSQNSMKAVLGKDFSTRVIRFPGGYWSWEGRTAVSYTHLTGAVRYKGFNDYRGGGHFSGRITAPLVFAGAICKQILEVKGIIVSAHINSIGKIKDCSFLESDISCLLYTSCKNNGSGKTRSLFYGMDT